MTPDESLNDGVDSPSGYWEIDALLDGELVDTQALRLALEDAGARDYLVEILRVRQLTRDLEPRRFPVPAASRGIVVRGVRWLAASLILAAGAGAGYVYGQTSHDRTPPASLEVAVVGNAPAPPAPEPTRYIRFEPGVNWTSGNRSH